MKPTYMKRSSDRQRKHLQCPRLLTWLRLRADHDPQKREHALQLRIVISRHRRVVAPLLALPTRRTFLPLGCVVRSKDLNTSPPGGGHSK